MSYLRHFPVDTLKIDRVFVRDIASKSAGNAPLVDAIIAMAKSLGLATVAEGVETEDAMALPQEPRRQSGSGVPVLPAAGDRRSGALARRLAALDDLRGRERRPSAGGRAGHPAQLALRAPDHLAAGALARQHSRHDEQEVRQPIQVFERVGGDVLDARKRPAAAFRAAANGARHVAGGRGRPAAGQNEVLERRQRFVEAVELGFQPFDVRRL